MTEGKGEGRERDMEHFLGTEFWESQIFGEGNVGEEGAAEGKLAGGFQEDPEGIFLSGEPNGEFIEEELDGEFIEEKPNGGFIPEEDLEMELSLEDGSCLSCRIAGVFMEQEKEYIALETHQDHQDMIYIMGLSQGEDDRILLVPLNDREEQERALAAFFQMAEDMADPHESDDEHNDGEYGNDGHDDGEYGNDSHGESEYSNESHDDGGHGDRKQRQRE